MEFDKTETIEGLTMMQVRAIFIEFPSGFSLEAIEQYLGNLYLEGLDFDSTIAPALLKGLETAGFIKKEALNSESDEPEFVWASTEKADSLRCANFSKRLTRKKADAMMEAFLTRCQATLRSDNPTVGIVSTVRVFGSYSRASEQEDFGDLDLVMECDPKFADPKIQRRYVLKVTKTAWWEGRTTWGTVAKYLRNCSGYFSICPFENYSILTKTNPKTEPIIFNSEEGGRLDVVIPTQFRRSKPQRAAYRRGWCDGRNQWSDETLQHKELLQPVYQQGRADGFLAIPVPKKAKAFRLKEFNVLILSDVSPTIEHDNVEVHQHWELPNPVQTLYLIRASAFLKTSLKDCISTLQAQNIPAIAAELKQESCQFELHAGHYFSNDSFTIESRGFSAIATKTKETRLPFPTIFPGSGEHTSMVYPLLVYSKGSDFLGAVGREWSRYWEKKELKEGYFFDSSSVRRYGEDHPPSRLIQSLMLSQDIALPKLIVRRSFSFRFAQGNASPEVDIDFRIFLYKRPSDNVLEVAT